MLSGGCGGGGSASQSSFKYRRNHKQTFSLREKCSQDGTISSLKITCGVIIKTLYVSRRKLHD